MKDTDPLLYWPRLTQRHRVAACRDMPGPPCWHAACGLCRATSPRIGAGRSHAAVVAWLAAHVRDAHGAALLDAVRAKKAEDEMERLRETVADSHRALDEVSKVVQHVDDDTVHDGSFADILWSYVRRSEAQVQTAERMTSYARKAEVEVDRLRSQIEEAIAAGSGVVIRLNDVEAERDRLRAQVQAVRALADERAVSSCIHVTDLAIDLRAALDTGSTS